MDTDTIADRVIAVDYGKSLADMIAAGKYNQVNTGIAPDNFPVDGTGTKTFRARLFHFDRYICSEVAAAAMKRDNFMPASHVHGLAFAAAFPDEQRKYPIACLGSSARVNGYRVVCLGRVGAGRYLSLFDWDGSWDRGWHFLGVQEVSAA
jgi:hypothetical protein